VLSRFRKIRSSNACYSKIVIDLRLHYRQAKSRKISMCTLNGSQYFLPFDPMERDSDCRVLPRYRKIHDYCGLLKNHRYMEMIYAYR
jgi:hypothetical protein